MYAYKTLGNSRKFSDVKNAVSGHACLTIRYVKGRAGFADIALEVGVQVLWNTDVAIAGWIHGLFVLDCLSLLVSHTTLGIDAKGP